MTCGRSLGTVGGLSDAAKVVGMKECELDDAE
jgi:hypothetical protein